MSTQEPKLVPSLRIPNGLDELEQWVQRDFEFLKYPARDWVPERYTKDGKRILDVLIIGAGQSGLATAFGLIQEKIFNILVVDENPRGKEGPWRTFARMKTLRTPKHLTGPDLGITSLTIRMWYEAQHGEGSWENLALVPKEMWADYLDWYRDTLELPVQNSTKVSDIEWNEAEKCFFAPAEINGEHRILMARKIVLATGIDGSGRWQAPKFITENLPSHLYSHTRRDIDFNALKGKRIGVIGAGASAFDNASVALEHGAKSVDLVFRRDHLVNVNSYRWAEFAGFLKHHADLNDNQKWRFISKIFDMGQLPPADTLERARMHPNFNLHPGTRIDNLSSDGKSIKLVANTGTWEFDFLIAATGFVTDLTLRPELSKIHDKIALWKDRYTENCNGSGYSELMLSHPYLGSAFEFQEKNSGEAPWLSSVYNYTFGCLLSMGFGGASISGMKYSIPRLVSGISRDLYREHAEYFYETLDGYDEKEF